MRGGPRTDYARWGAWGPAGGGIESRRMRTCVHCGGRLEGRFRFCPWCATPARSKLVDFFWPTEFDSGKALRVSRYLREHHVRFSVWNEDGTAEAAVSLDEDEAARLASFLTDERSLTHRLRDALHL